MSGLQFILSDSGVNLVLTQRKSAGELTGLHAEFLFTERATSDFQTSAILRWRHYGANCLHDLHFGLNRRPKGAPNTHRGLCKPAALDAGPLRLIAARLRPAEDAFFVPTYRLGRFSSAADHRVPGWCSQNLAAIRTEGILVELIFAAYGVTRSTSFRRCCRLFSKIPAWRSVARCGTSFCSGERALSRELEGALFRCLWRRITRSLRTH